MGPLGAGENVAMFGKDGRRAGVRSVDMHPHVVLLSNAYDLGNRVDAGRRCCSDRRHDATGALAGSFVLLEQRGHCVRTHATLGVYRNFPYVVLTAADT